MEGLGVRQPHSVTAGTSTCPWPQEHTPYSGSGSSLFPGTDARTSTTLSTHMEGSAAL